MSLNALSGIVGILAGLAAIIAAIAGGVSYLVAGLSRNAPAQAGTSQPSRRQVVVTTGITAFCVAVLVGAILLITGTVPLPFVTPNPYFSQQGTLQVNDTLQNLTGNWELSHNSNVDQGRCEFTADAYYAIQPKEEEFTTCIYQSTNPFHNFTFEVKMTIIQGDCGGFVFDDNDVTGNFYYFRVCQADGAATLNISKGNTHIQSIPLGMSATFNTGLRQPNLLAVVVQDGNFDFYVNKQKLPNVLHPQSGHSASDNTYSEGNIGVIANNLGLSKQPAEVAFTDARVWTQEGLFQ